MNFMPYVNLALSALSAGIIQGGTMLLATGSNLESRTVWIAAGVTTAVAIAQQLRSNPIIKAAERGE